MAVSMWKSHVVSSQWRVCRFYFSVIGMDCRSIHNAPIPRKVTSNTELRPGRMERNFINGECCLSNKTSCMHKHVVYPFHTGGNCGVRKSTQTRDLQSRNAGVNRWYSDDRGPPREKLPNLMDFPEIVWPSVVKAFRNWILTNILIKPYFDKDFGIPDFVLGSKQCAAKKDEYHKCTVSTKTLRQIFRIAPSNRPWSSPGPKLLFSHPPFYVVFYVPKVALNKAQKLGTTVPPVIHSAHAFAVEYVSGCISRGDFAALENVVTQDALQELKRNISTFTLQQRQDLALSKEDIYFCFPYEIGIMFINDDKSEQKRFVEITMCYHVLRGLKLLREQGITPPLNMGMLPEYTHKLYICNYRFIREFTKGVEDQWTVNIINHFKPSDHIS